MTQTAPPDARPSIGELVGRLTEHLGTLVRDEIALAKAQLTRKIQRSLLGVVAFAVAGVVALFAVGVLLAAAVLGLATVLPAWLAALIVGGALLLVAGIAVLVGRRALRAPMPDAAANIKLDVDAVRQGVRS